MQKDNITFKEIWFTVFFILIVFQSMLAVQINSVFMYTDEIFSMLGFVSLITKKINNVSSLHYKYIKTIAVCLVLVVIIGLVSSYLSHLQPFGIIWANDILNLLKCYLIMRYAMCLLKNVNHKALVGLLGKIVAIYIVIGFVFCLLNYVTPAFDTSDEIRFGIPNYRFFHTNAGEFSTILICLLAFLHIFKLYSPRNSDHLILLLLICLAATTRGKAFGVMCAYLGFRLFFAKKSQLSMKYIVTISLLCLAAGYFQIEEYFGNDETPRYVLLFFGILTANTYFPFGGGFASYGSNMARVHYSPLYNQYGFNLRYGMDEKSGEADEISFLNDNFWPMILGQYGYIGTILYLCIVYKLFQIARTLNTKNLQIAGLTLFFTLIISSTAGCVFVSSWGAAVMLLFGMLIYYSKVNELEA